MNAQLEMKFEFSYPSKTEILSLIAKTEFRPFDKWDWQAFAGCETDSPMIGEANGMVIVIDGDMINAVYEGDVYGGVGYEIN